VNGAEGVEGTPARLAALPLFKAAGALARLRGGALYPSLQAPTPDFHDWVGRAEGTVSDLAKAPDTRVRHYSQRQAFVR